jgi:glycosyltransferase involved in cell wall biosynthesis
LRILVLSNLYPPDYIGGYELCCRQVVDGLLGRDHDVRVLTTTPRVPCPAEEHVDRSFKLTNCYDAYCILRSQRLTRRMWEASGNLVDAHNVQVLLTALEEFRPDVVYLWNIAGIGGLGLLGCLHQLRFHWVWYLGDCVPRMLCSPGKRLLPVVAEEFSRQIRGYYMPVSQRVVQEIEAAGVQLKGVIDTMPNWILGEQPAPRRDYYSKGRPLRIISAGQMGRHKGIDLLIEAARLLKDRGYDDFSIDLYGKVTDPTVFHLLAEQGVADRVFFRGACSQQELVGRYADHEFDVFAFPTWEREPFGCAPLEAAAYGCVMVMTQSCGIGEWFVHGVHCLKAERSAEAFAASFQGILDGRTDLAPLGRRASAAIWRDFHLDALLPRIEQALESAADQPRTGASTPEDTYRLALLAERLTTVLVQGENAAMTAA